MATLLFLLALGAPAAGSSLIRVLRPEGLRVGRVLAIACGVATISSFLLLGWSATTAGGIVEGPTWSDLELGRAAAVLLAMVSATGLVVTSFARRSLDVDPRARWFFIRFGVLLTGSALVVVPDGPLLLALGWLASSWALTDLVGFTGDDDSAVARRRTRRAIAVGDAALIASVVVGAAAGWAGMTSAAAREASWGAIAGVSVTDIVAVLIVVAGVSRSSLVPLHRWLVTTVIAPTPVSALVHAGFVSGAGLLLIRFADLFVSSDAAVYLAFFVAVATVVVALGAQKTRVDIKGKLAWSTVSQMGFMVLQCTVGAFSSAMVHIVGHGMYKASLFLGTGDAISAHLRARRHPDPSTTLSPTVAVVVSALVATGATGIGLTVLPPEVTDAGLILIAAFAWLTVFNGCRGWLDRSPTVPGWTIAIAAAGALAATFSYLTGLRILETFAMPAFGTLPSDAGVPVPLVIGALAAAAAGLLVVRFVAPPAARAAVDARLERIAHPGIAPGRRHLPDTAGRAADVPVIPDPPDGVRRALLRSDVARARSIVSPLWPLTSFVAVNPLGTLERRPFDEACSLARHHLGARTHLSLDGYRADHERGLTTTDDLRWAIAGHLIDHDLPEQVVVDGRRIDVADVVEADLLHGPEIQEGPLPLTPLERHEGVDGPVGALIDATIAHSAAHHATRSAAPNDAADFVRRWWRDARSVGTFGQLVDDDVLGWFRELGDDPFRILDASLAAVGVTDDDRVETLARHLARLPGWSGYARWRSEWAHPNEQAPRLDPLDLVAARSALEAAWLLTVGAAATSAPPVPAVPARDPDRERTAAVLSALGATDTDPASHPSVAEVVGAIPAERRSAIWLAAQERNFDRRLLTTLDRLDPGRRLDPPPAQLAFCIDVRSEGLRRHLEETGPYETLGFAGFFGIPMSVRRLEWPEPEPRAPVLVAPSVPAVEQGRASSTDTHRIVGTALRRAGLHEVAARAKNALGAGFVTAEASGWLTGPMAAARTFLPREAAPAPQRPTAMTVATGDVGQRVDMAEAVLTTMGLTVDFAPLVVLCGHASANVNNPHATSLDCGACAGASGEDNARAVAALLNETEVRRGLADRGIAIPTDTHFMPALHDTVSDRVDLLDLDSAPASHRQRVEQLATDLRLAGQRQSARRAVDLPGPARAVRRRGTDWAQIRPEWGLARNAAFIIGPRSMTAGLDLDGRAFLHSYDADRDPGGRVLETIMTAPLVVGHWISAQYYFSTVDPESFGAGDKLIHNAVGGIGVISGEHGDLRVGLPIQSTHRGTERHHQPIRLVAVIQAPLEHIEATIRRNSVLGTLTSGNWLRIVGRSHPHERWSVRSPGGTWSAEPRPLDTVHAQEHR